MKYIDNLLCARYKVNTNRAYVTLPMKTLLIRYILIACLFIYSGNLCAQQRYFCEIKGIEKEFSSGLKIIFDFGTEPSYTLTGVSGKLKPMDENGGVINFNSMVDAANYMASKGWIFLQAYSSFYGGSPILHWVFFKDADSLEKAVDGIVFKSSVQSPSD